MKNIGITLLSLLSLFQFVFGQKKTDLQVAALDNITRTGLQFKPNLDNYPYLAVSVLFRNESKLSDKEFLGLFNDMDFFFSEICITHAQKETFPLFFLKKEKGIFSSVSFGDKTVVRKIPIDKFSANIPSININVTTNIKNEAVAVIKWITDKIAPIIGNPTSIYGTGSSQLAFGFLTDIVTQLSDITNKQINAVVGFDAFAASEINIHPYLYKIGIIKPMGTSLPKGTFTIRADKNNQLYLYLNEALFKEYPYFIIQVGLSNYLDIDGLPSKFYNRNGNCNITKIDFAKLEHEFAAIKAKLTDDQLAAEQNLLDLYRYNLIILEGVNAQGPNPNEQKLLEAYNALFEFQTKKNEIKIDTTLLAQHYGSIYKNLLSCIYSNANLLSIYKQILIPVFAVLDKPLDKIDNTDLTVLTNYIENTKKLNFISNSIFHSNIVMLQMAAEKHLYATKFKQLITTISDATAVNEELKKNVYTLIDLKNKMDKCHLCLQEATYAEKNYAILVRNEQEKRDQILEIVEKSNIAYTKGYAALQKLEFVLEKSVDTLTQKLTIIVPIDKIEFELTLKNLKANKEMLNEKMAKANFATTDLTEITYLINLCTTAINEIHHNVDFHLSKLFEHNDKVFTSQ